MQIAQKRKVTIFFKFFRELSGRIFDSRADFSNFRKQNKEFLFNTQLFHAAKAAAYSRNRSCRPAADRTLNRIDRGKQARNTSTAKSRRFIGTTAPTVKVAPTTRARRNNIVEGKSALRHSVPNRTRRRNLCNLHKKCEISFLRRKHRTHDRVVASLRPERRTEFRIMRRTV